MREKRDQRTDRRRFLIGLDMTGAAVSRSGRAAAASAASAAPNASGSVSWDQEREVVIIGSGFAGLAEHESRKPLCEGCHSFKYPKHKSGGAERRGAQP